MSISVIIPTYNAQNYLPKLLKTLFSQTIEFELIIIDSSSTDNTLDIAKEYAAKIIKIDKEVFDHGGTRTKALKEASGDIVIFLTQDALPLSNNTLETLIEPLKSQDISAVYGRQIPYKDASIFGKHLREYNYKDSSYVRELKDAKEYGIKCVFFSDSFAAYKRDDIKSIGYFKEGMIVGEDMHLVARLLLNGKKIAYNADAKVYHSHNYTIKEEFQRYFDTGVFHTKESWIVEKFGAAEGEGSRYIKSELKYILKSGEYIKVVDFIIRNGAKFIGYKLGKNYQKLPKSVAKSFSMHKNWWDRWA